MGATESILALVFTAANIAITLIVKSNTGIAEKAKIEQRVANLESRLEELALREETHKRETRAEISDLRSQVNSRYFEK